MYNLITVALFPGGEASTDVATGGWKDERKKETAAG
jgi:hypothetical protein